MFNYLKDQYQFGLSQEEKKEMKQLQKDLKKFKEMDLVSKSNSNSGSEDN